MNLFRRISFRRGNPASIMFFWIAIRSFNPRQLNKQISLTNLIILACFSLPADYYVAYCCLEFSLWLPVKYYGQVVVCIAKGRMARWLLFDMECWSSKGCIADAGWVRGCLEATVVVFSTGNEGTGWCSFISKLSAMQAWLSHSCCVFLLAFILCTVSCCFQVHYTFSTSWEKAVLCDEARQCYGSFSVACADGGQRTESLFPTEVVFVPLAYTSKGSRQGKPSGYSHWVGLSWRHQRALYGGTCKAKAEQRSVLEEQRF